MRYVNISLENKPDIRNTFRNERNYILNEINNRLDDVRKIINEILDKVIAYFSTNKVLLDLKYSKSNNLNTRISTTDIEDIPTEELKKLYHYIFNRLGTIEERVGNRRFKMWTNFHLEVSTIEELKDIISNLSNDFNYRDCISRLLKSERATKVRVDNKSNLITYKIELDRAVTYLTINRLTNEAIAFHDTETLPNRISNEYLDIELDTNTANEIKPVVSDFILNYDSIYKFYINNIKFINQEVSKFNNSNFKEFINKSDVTTLLGFINFLELYLYIFNYILEYTQFTQGILIQLSNITN